VQKKFLDINGIAVNSPVSIDQSAFIKNSDLKKNITALLPILDGQTIVYRGKRKQYTENLANQVRHIYPAREKSELAEYLENTISPDWSLIDCLNHGVAFHHGALPKYIQTEIIDAFNSGAIEVLVCTSTIIEGVNTTAKNVVIYDNQKGDAALTG